MGSGISVSGVPKNVVTDVQLMEGWTVAPTTSKIWEYIKEVHDFKGDMKPKHREFVDKLYKHTDPHNAEEELSDKQIRWIFWLRDGYIHNTWEKW